MNDRKVGGYRYCFVPMCTNTTKSAPSKVFVKMPREEETRRLWFRLARRVDTPTKTTNYFCCEDHFVLKDDMENYVRFCLMGAPIKMKPGVVPRIFFCQPDRQRTAPLPLRLASENRRRKGEVADILASARCSTAEDEEKENRKPSNSTPEIPVVPHVEHESANVEHATANMEHAGANVEHKPVSVDDLSNICLDNDIIHEKSVQHRGVQVNLRPHVRSRGVSCKLTVPTINASCSPIKFDKTASTTISQRFDKVHAPANSKQSSGGFFSTSVSSLLGTDSSEYRPHSEEAEEILETEKRRMQCNALTMTNYFISTNTKRYLGILNEWHWIIDVLHSQTQIPANDIRLTLMKIKVNDSFERISEQFGISPVQASNVFAFCIPRLAHMLKTLINFTESASVKKALPIPFRANYSNVESIIDCFEIEIQKPRNAVNQALTWSEYKKANTIKYLVSSTPDGLINFISKGYGGRISDQLITEQSGFVDAVPEGCHVMADRGFKQIQSLLNKKNCRLIRPPSVLSSQKPSKSEVLETKRIASLRIHIERVIGRLRQYEMLKPHSCVHHNLLPQMDGIVTIAAALNNIQTPIIRT